MIVIVTLACLITAATIWFLSRTEEIPDARGEALQLVAVRDRLVAQLRELSADQRDQRVDAGIASAEQGRLEFELAEILKQLEGMPEGAAAPAGKAGRSPWVLGVLALFVPLVAGTLYVLQSQAWLHAVLQPKAMPVAAASPAVPPFVLQMVARLQTHLQHHPEDLQGWMQLARSQSVLGHPHQAALDYAQAYRLAPGNVTVVSNYAWALYSRNPTRTVGTVARLYHHLYQLDPRRQDALWFLGLESYNKGQLQGALGYWRRLLQLMPAGSPAKQGVQDAIANVQQVLKKHSGPVKAPG